MSAARKIALERVDLRLGQADGAALDADELSVIATEDGSRFAKRIYAVDGGGWDADPVPRRSRFRWGKIDASTMHALHAGLATVYDTPGAASINGAPARFRVNADMSVRNGRRKLTQTDRKARRAMVLDCDGMPIRLADYPTAEEGARALADAVPAPFRGAECLVVLSSTAGLPGQERWKAQLWYLLDEPVGEKRKKAAIEALNAQIKAATGQEESDGRPIDPKPAEAVQPRYGRPEFDSVADPFPGDSRFIRIEGDRRRVRAADLPVLDESGKAKSKGRAATGGSILGRKRKPKEAGAIKAARSVGAYDVESREIPADAALFEPRRDGTSTGAKYAEAARDIERLVHMRWQGRVPHGWRIDVLFRATTLAACAEGLPNGARVREIAEEYRRRLAPNMDRAEVAQGMGSIAARADRDRERSAELGRPLEKAEIAKYTYRLSTIVWQLLISPAEQMRLQRLHTPKVADRKRKTGGAAKRTVATTSAVSLPNADQEPKSTAAEGGKPMGLKAMKAAAKAQADASPDEWTDAAPRRQGSGLSAMKRKPEAAPAPAKRPQIDPDDPFAELGAEVVEWTAPPETPCEGRLARFLGTNWTREDVRALSAKEPTDKRAAATLSRARALYAEWRRKEIERRAA